LPPEAGLQMLRIFHEYPSKSSAILSNLVSAEMKMEDRQEEGPTSSDLKTNSMRRSWQSNPTSNDDMSRSSSNKSFQFDNIVDSYYRHSALSNRRNTISLSGPVGSSANRLSTSATPNGMRHHDSFVQMPSLNLNQSGFRGMMSGFSGAGEMYTTRYPSFHERNSRGYEDDGPFC
jgi:hypothetical protein